MTKPKLTPWFPGTVKPVRPGVYQRQFPGRKYRPHFSKWDGQMWRFLSFDADRAALMTVPSDSQDRIWRGLAEKP